MEPVRNGPLYCETGHPWAFIAEPVNTFTNFAILIAAFAAMHFLLRRSGQRPPLDLSLLVALLFATGLGSFFWHAMRTRLGLILDAAPGVLFLLTFIFLWLRALYGTLAGAGATLFVTASTMGAMAFARAQHALPQGGTPVAIVPFHVTLLLIGCGFVALTWRLRGPAFGRSAAFILGTGGTAALFRTLDFAACGIVPFGTHFLWHIFLSLAAFLSIAFLARMKDVPPAHRA